MKRVAASSLLLYALLAPGVSAQQVADSDFKFANPAPAFAEGQGPVVCIDEAHNNFHTAGGRYASFADLLRGDGYRVESSTAPFTAESLAGCRVMVIANAMDAKNQGNWAYPHASPFSQEEIVAVFQWIRGGGALLLIADHSPMAGAAADLGAMLGVGFLDGYARVNPGGGELPDVFTLEGGGLGAHAVTRGRVAKESVAAVGTFTGSAFRASLEFMPLLTLPDTAVVEFRWSQSLGDDAPPREEWPRIAVAGWLQGAARALGHGRVVVLGEAAMCTAQLFGPERRPMGMNHPGAPQNPQFCLNTVRWLSGVLEPPPPEGETKPDN